MGKAIERVKKFPVISFLLLKYKWSHCGGILCIISLPMIDAWFSSDRISYLYLVVSIFGIVFLFMGGTGRVDSYKKKIGGHRKFLQEVLNGHLREIANSFGYTDQERISIYQFLPKEGQFECVARYSLHGPYNFPPSRDRYPLDNGIIASVWNKPRNKGFINDLFPDYDKDRAGYERHLRNKYGIKEEVYKKFKMHPMHIIAGNVRGGRGEKIAVIVFESERSNFLKPNKIKLTYENERSNMMEILLDKIRES